MKRYDFIDYAKGLAIMLVVIGHLLQYNFSGTSSKGLFDLIYSFHMPLFMFLSGYVASFSIERNIDNKMKFILRKARAFLVPFAFMGGNHATL